MTKEQLKEALVEFLPKKNEYNLYLYEKFGKILYLEEWESIKEFDTNKREFWREIHAVLIVIERFTWKEQINIIDFIFHFVRQNLMKEKKNN